MKRATYDIFGQHCVQGGERERGYQCSRWTTSLPSLFFGHQDEHCQNQGGGDEGAGSGKYRVTTTQRLVQRRSEGEQRLTGHSRAVYPKKCSRTGADLAGDTRISVREQAVTRDLGALAKALPLTSKPRTTCLDGHWECAGVVFPEAFFDASSSA